MKKNPPNKPPFIESQIIPGKPAAPVNWIMPIPGANSGRPDPMKLFNPAFLRGKTTAPIKLGLEYHIEELFPIDLKCSVPRFREVIENHVEKGEKVNVTVLLGLGICYFRGAGEPANPVVGYALVRLSVKRKQNNQFYEKALAIYNTFEVILTEPQKKEGRILIQQITKEKSILAPIDRYLANSWRSF